MELDAQEVMELRSSFKARRIILDAALEQAAHDSRSQWEVRIANIANVRAKMAVVDRLEMRLLRGL